MPIAAAIGAGATRRPPVAAKITNGGSWLPQISSFTDGPIAGASKISLSPLPSKRYGVADAEYPSLWRLAERARVCAIHTRRGVYALRIAGNDARDQTFGTAPCRSDQEFMPMHDDATRRPAAPLRRHQPGLN
jgi:hypothetical protein